MKKEIVACDVCGLEMKEGFILKGSLKHTCALIEDIGGEDTELHFHEYCLISKMFPGYNIAKKRNGRKSDAEVKPVVSVTAPDGALGDDIFSEITGGTA